MNYDNTVSKIIIQLVHTYTHKKITSKVWAGKATVTPTKSFVGC